jgi:hypothetical protein
MSRRDEYCFRARDVSIRVVDVTVLSSGTSSSSSSSSSGGGGGRVYHFGTGRIAPLFERAGPGETAGLCGSCRQNIIMPNWGNIKCVMSMCPNCCGEYASRYGMP